MTSDSDELELYPPTSEPAEVPPPPTVKKRGPVATFLMVCFAIWALGSIASWFNPEDPLADTCERIGYDMGVAWHDIGEFTELCADPANY